jgi:uncharacterized membrane protein HdeD (DUF308 family)
MLSSVTRNWWVAALRGTLAVVFGVAAFAWPGITFEVLVLLFGAYAFVDGVLLLTFGFWAAGAHQPWWPLVLGGMVGLATGVLTFAQPQAMALALVYVVGAWAIVVGILTIVAAIRLRQIITSEWLMGLGGALSIIFGLLVIAQPGAGALTLVYLFGFYAILAGIAQIGFGVRLRSLGQSLAPGAQRAPSPSR